LYAQARGRDATVAAIARTPPDAAIGTTLYSDLGFILIGAALERASGSGLDALFHARIAQPLRLQRAGFARAGSGRFPDAAATERGNVYERDLAGDAGSGHAWRQEIPPGEVHDGNAAALCGVAGHAGLFATAEEVARIANELLQPEVLPLDAHARGRLLRPAGGPGSRTFGWVLARDSDAARGILPDDAPGHTGFTGASVWLDPGDAAVFVLLSNRVHPSVPAGAFQEVRAGFHRCALASIRPASQAPLDP
jgi:CubicO group peptidase (beta-lactamase class C family)